MRDLEPGFIVGIAIFSLTTLAWLLLQNLTLGDKPIDERIEVGYVASEPTMYHCKVVIVDGLWTSVGSTNFDSRSFSVHDEANLNVPDATFAQAQRAIFDADLRLSRRVTLAEWERRGCRH